MSVGEGEQRWVEVGSLNVKLSVKARARGLSAISRFFARIRYPTGTGASLNVVSESVL